MNQKASELIKSLNKNNEEIYGKAVSEFISKTALSHGYMQFLICVIAESKSSDMEVARQIIINVFDDNSSLLAHKLELDETPMELISYLTLGKKMYEKVQECHRESSD